MDDFDTLRAHYTYFSRFPTRWMDNDVYGHVNNAVYYSYFDTVVMEFLIRKCGLDIHNDPVIGYAVASSCQYLAPITHPADVDAGFRVNRLGNSSVEYGIGIFLVNEDRAAAFGTFTHAFVDRATDSAVAIPSPIRQVLEGALAQRPG
jgi:acyl-CoA thioester hydrolase